MTFLLDSDIHVGGVTPRGYHLRTSAEEVYDERDDRDGQENVNQAARNVKCEPTEDPYDK
jgi:hypothetical protein